MEEFAELRDIANRSDEATRRRLLRYVELKQTLTELTGDAMISEATPLLGLLYDQHPKKREIVMTAGQLRKLGRITFPRLEP